MTIKFNAIAGLGAGFAATIALSALMLMKQSLGLMPDLNPIEMMASAPSWAASMAYSHRKHSRTLRTSKRTSRKRAEKNRGLANRNRKYAPLGIEAAACVLVTGS